MFAHEISQIKCKETPAGLPQLLQELSLKNRRRHWVHRPRDHSSDFEALQCKTVEGRGRRNDGWGMCQIQNQLFPNKPNPQLNMTNLAQTNPVKLMYVGFLYVGIFPAEGGRDSLVEVCMQGAQKVGFKRTRKFSWR